MSYFVYIVKCADTTYYCGYTNNLVQRIVDHNTNDKGAKYTHNRRPVTLLYSEEFQTLSEALKREAAIKKLTRNQKTKLINSIVHY